eukprot:COSAG02_NODE_84_length_39615_cov_144.775256_13_plen_92_part_00
MWAETHVCRQWAATTSGVQAMGFSRAGIGVFVVAALVVALAFLGVGIGVFVGRGTGVYQAGATIFFWEKICDLYVSYRTMNRSSSWPSPTI